MCFSVCRSYLSVCVHNLVLYFAVYIWACGQNTINRLKSEDFLSGGKEGRACLCVLDMSLTKECCSPQMNTEIHA